MDDLFKQAIALVRGMWQRRWIGLAAAWIVGIAGVFVIMRLPDVYEASARIYVDTQSVLKPLMQGLAVQPNVDQQVMILSRTLISRPNVEKLVRMADLDLAVKTKAEHDATVDGLTKSLRIESLGRDNLYTLAYRDSQPERAKRVVQSLTSIFVESNLGDKRKDSDAAKKFLDEQIKVYEKKLEEAENRLKDFKIRHMSSQESVGKDYFTRLNELTLQLNQSRLELREAEQSRDTIKREISGEEPILMPEDTPASIANANASASVPEIDGRLEAMKRNLDNLLQKYTDQHPDVVGARRVIQELEEQKAQILAARRKSAGPGTKSGPSMAGNPVYQQLKVSLAESEATVAQLRTRVAEYESRYARLKDSAKVMPQMEAEFAQLNRDYDVHRKNYEVLVSRRESAEMSGEMDAVAGADFRLIDPPRVSPQPVAPNRLLLLFLAFAAALGAGALASFVASQIWPTFFDQRALREQTGLPVLGSVSMILGEAQKRRERRGLIGFLSGTFALVGSYGAGLLVLLFLSTRAV
ncbi:MAG TPA: XrtA system polysaccharide chain length determinant [Casimicrobiaceae bacterium]|nr:XrtA system polysaccharide chain length determinant [Casimicrobiaceae bacterium]